MFSRGRLKHACKDIHWKLKKHFLKGTERKGLGTHRGQKSQLFPLPGWCIIYGALGRFLGKSLASLVGNT